MKNLRHFLSFTILTFLLMGAASKDDGKGVEITAKVVSYNAYSSIDDYGPGGFAYYGATTLRLLNPKSVADREIRIYHSDKVSEKSVWRALGRQIKFTLESIAALGPPEDPAMLFSGAASQVRLLHPEPSPNSLPRTRENFRRYIKPGLSHAELIGHFGIPDKDIGSGLHIFVYRLQDGSEARLGYSSLERIRYADIVRPDGKKERLFEAPP